MAEEYMDLEIKCSECGKVLNVSELVEDGEADWEGQSPAPYTVTSFSTYCPECGQNIIITVGEEPVDVTIDMAKVHKTMACGHADVGNSNRKQSKKPFNLLKRRK